MTESETLFNGRWLRLKRRGRWEYVERVNPAGAVIVIAVTDAGEVLFVEQYREPIQGRTIEMPAGLVGDMDEHAHEGVEETARRELIEEAGYRAENIEFLHAGPSSAGMSTEVIAFVRARGLTKVGEGGGDSTEQIVVHRVPRAECHDWLVRKGREGYSIDPKLFAGLYFLGREER